MKKCIFVVLIALLSFPAFVVAQQVQAKAVLDKTAGAFKKAGGIQASFTIKSVSGGRTVGSDNGTIQLKGDQFMLRTSDMVTWFNGKTQWSYVEKNDEVNVSTPTQAELQQINPYTFLYLYQKGYSYRMGPTTTFHGKAVAEVILTAHNKKQDPGQITLYVDKKTYEPLFIMLQQHAQNICSEITITSYRSGLKFADTAFSFDRKQYPSAEIIDLR